MAEFVVHVMTDKSKEPENLPRQGFVNEVCREFLIHEDQALAHRLQNEEYEHHFGHNRERNAILRQDAPRAKEEQLMEDEAAAHAQSSYHMELLSQEAEDAALAEAVANKFDYEQQDQLRRQEVEDLKLAKSILDHEKAVAKQTKELKQVEREAAYLGINSGLDNVALLSRKDRSRGADSSKTPDDDDDVPSTSAPPPVLQQQQVGRRRPIASLMDGATDADLSDLSDFCRQPTQDMNEDESRVLQEEQDEELARLLQEQDLKRRGDLLHEDQLMAIEAQDRELAKVLQEQERAKAKKAREKARQKAFLKQNPTGIPETSKTKSSPGDPITSPDRASTSSNSSRHTSPAPDAESPAPHNESGGSFSGRLNSSLSPALAGVPSSSSSPQRPDTLDLPGPSRSSPYRKVSPTRQMNHSSKTRGLEAGIESLDVIKGSYKCNTNSPSSLTGVCGTPGGFTNIACAIDPTYQRRVMQGELLPTPTSPSSTGLQATTSNTSSLSSTSSSTSGIAMSSSGTGAILSSISSPLSPLPPPVFDDDDDDDDDYPVPPYMPIQGQRRTASLEKTRKFTKMPKDKSNTKDNCKQQ